MSVLPRAVGAITLFVADADRSARFYQDIFGGPIVYQDADSAVFNFGSVMINLLQLDAAKALVDPVPVAGGRDGTRFALSVWVDDVDAIAGQLRHHGVDLLLGPTDRDWGKRTANFADPDGHIWEIAQDIPAAVTHSSP